MSLTQRKPVKTQNHITESRGSSLFRKTDMNSEIRGLRHSAPLVKLSRSNNTFHISTHFQKYPCCNFLNGTSKRTRNSQIKEPIRNQTEQTEIITEFNRNSLKRFTKLRVPSNASINKNINLLKQLQNVIAKKKIRNQHDQTSLKTQVYDEIFVTELEKLRQNKQEDQVSQTQRSKAKSLYQIIPTKYDQSQNSCLKMIQNIYKQQQEASKDMKNLLDVFKKDIDSTHDRLLEYDDSVHDLTYEKQIVRNFIVEHQQDKDYVNNIHYATKILINDKQQNLKLQKLKKIRDLLL